VAPVTEKIQGDALLPLILLMHICDSFLLDIM
jgi:hypothetical protein